MIPPMPSSRRRTDGAGDTTSYSCNSLSRQTRVTFPDGNVPSAGNLDASGNTLASNPRLRADEGGLGTCVVAGPGEERGRGGRFAARSGAAFGSRLRGRSRPKPVLLPTPG
jgi:YD repeat-containing protein